MSAKRILTYGTFDLFHLGHLRILERAKALGDYLLVGVSTDEFNQIKGKAAVYPFEHRASIVSALRCVDEVIAEESWEQKERDIKTYDISCLVMGDDWTGKFDFLMSLSEVVYLPRTPGISSAALMRTLKTDHRSSK